MDDIMEFTDESVVELSEMNQSIKMFTESALELIDNMEQAEYLRAAYFTEAASEDEDAAHNKANKNILAKICDSIAKIFSKLASLVSKGKTKAKGVSQGAAMRSIANKLKDFPDVSVTIQDVWSFNQFADKTIDTYIKKFNKSNITLFWKTVKGDKAITSLTKSMNLVASQMRSPSNKKFVVKGPGINGGTVAAALGILTAGNVVSGAEKSVMSIVNRDPEMLAYKAKVNEADDRYFDDAAKKRYLKNIKAQKTPTSEIVGKAIKPGLKQYGNDLLNGVKSAPEKAKSITPGKVVATAKKVPGKINKQEAMKLLKRAEFNFVEHKEQVATAAVITALVTTAVVLTSCPKKLGVEKVGIKELYKRLTTLSPEKFPSMVADTAKKVNTYMQKSETLMEFSKTLDGSKGAVKYSQEISALLAAYTAFHQSLIDFYLGIITSVLKAGGVTNSKKIYTAESTEEFYDDDSYDYTESYDDENDDVDHSDDYTESDDYNFSDDDNNDEDYTESEMYTNDDFTDLDSFIEANMSDMSC